MDLSILLRAKEVWDRFGASHPQFPAFLNCLRERDALKEGTAVEIDVTPPEGQMVRAKLRLSAQEAQVLGELLQQFTR